MSKKIKSYKISYKPLLLLATIFLGEFAIANIANAQDNITNLDYVVNAQIDANTKSEPITRYEYGMFIEPIGKLVDEQMWAELIDDRKFYFPIAELNSPDAPTNSPVRFKQNKWYPIGSLNAISYEKTNPFVGDQSPIINLNSTNDEGIYQEGIKLQKGRSYVGRVVLKSSGKNIINIDLSNNGEKLNILKKQNLGDKWQTIEFKFTASFDSENAKINVSGKGLGSFSIGSISLMPSDNLDGWRKEVIEALRPIKSGMWRLPGGNFLSNWDWHDAIGPLDKRVPVMDNAWGVMQTNDIGMDEYLRLCELIDTMPYITVNAGLGDGNSAAELVEYINGDKNTYWGNKRYANGHQNPYKVKYWNIGNEPYGDWQIGKTSLDYYAMKHIDFAKRMKKADPSIILTASGAMPDQRKWPGVIKENSTIESIQPKFGTELDWTGGLFAKAGDYFDGMTEHWYDTAEKRPNAPLDDELLEYTRQPSNLVYMKALEWNIYKKKYPIIEKKKQFLAIDEYAITGSTPNLKSALSYAMVLNEMLRHTEFIKMGAFTTGISTLDINSKAATLNANGIIFKLFGEHLGEGVTPIKISGNAPWPPPKYPVGLAHPQVVAGSSTYPLDIIAALSPNKDKLILSIVNPTYSTKEFSPKINGIAINETGSSYLLTNDNLEVQNKAGEPAKLEVLKSETKLENGKLKIPAKSFVIYEFPVK